MSKAIKKSAKVEEEKTRTPKKYFVVQVAKIVDGEKQLTVEYPETSTTEKSLQFAIKKHTGVIGVQVTGEYKTAGDLIKALQPKPAK